jgi:hypothetical protein
MSFYLLTGGDQLLGQPAHQKFASRERKVTLPKIK